MTLGDRVKLTTFNGTKMPDVECKPGENYWKLIGAEGVIVQVRRDSAESRVLVEFTESIATLGLHCHNEVTNSLWIRRSDLEILQQPESDKNRTRNA